VPNIRSERPAETRDFFVDLFGFEVATVHAKAVERGFEIAYPLRDEEWGLGRFMLRDPSGTVVNVLSHIPREGQDTAPAPR
jgi:hypothetical protein